MKHEECLIRGRDRREASETAARMMIEELQRELAANPGKPVSLAWCGGTSPADIFTFFIKRFAEIPAADRSRIHFVCIDERRVPLADAQSNFRMLEESLFAPLREADLLDPACVHPFPVDAEPEQACREYTQLVEKTLDGINIAVLGVGPDGHVAALFPTHSSIKAKKNGFIFVADRPKPPKEGFTASVALLKTVKIGFVLFFGDEKEKPLLDYLGGTEIEPVPARIAKCMRRAYVVTDRSISPQYRSTIGSC